jgi:hypothetical protein
VSEIVALPKPERRARKPRRPLQRGGVKGKRTSKRRKAREKDCDRVFSLLIRTRDDWQCRACGSPQVPQCAHIYSRQYRQIRFDPENAVCLCSRHHRMWSYPNTVEWEDWVEEHFPGRLEVLKARIRTQRWSKDYDGMLAGLNAQLEALQARRGGAN